MLIGEVRLLIAGQTNAYGLLDAAIMEELDPTDQRVEADQFLARVNVASKLLNNFIAHIAGIT